MNYKHAYHAGNFADVFKHWILTLLLEKLQQKPTPFGVLDTHAGAGFYDLRDQASQKTGEYEQGIAKLFNADNLPPAFAAYKALIAGQQITPDLLTYYPGSPAIIAEYLREQDSLISCELHEATYEYLKENLENHPKKIALHKQDAYLAMKAFLPLKEKRGLILIDPPFEKTTEFTDILAALKIALQRFNNGIYAIWYPIKHRPPVRQFHEKLQQLAQGKILIVELLCRDDDSAETLNGCGMAIINPPWQLQDILETNLPWLAQLFALDKKAQAKIFSL